MEMPNTQRVQQDVTPVVVDAPVSPITTVPIYRCTISGITETPALVRFRRITSRLASRPTGTITSRHRHPSEWVLR